MWRSRVTYLGLIFLVTAATIVTVTYLRPHEEPSELMLYESHLDDQENRMRWDAVRQMSNPIKQGDLHLFNLYQQYKNSSTSNRPIIAKEILDAVNKLAYLDSRIHMIGLLLFGPTKTWSTLRAAAVRVKHPAMIDHGLESSLKLFEKHCGASVLTEHSMKQSLANIYHYVLDKEAFHEAIRLACGMNTVHSHGIVDMANPKIDITPAPLHGSFQYCGRVSVNAMPTLKAQSYGKMYQLKVVPSMAIPHRRHSMIHICLHHNDSLGLCECEKHDWMPIQKGSWTFFMPSDDKTFVDVKFAAGLSHSVTVSLDEVSPANGWREGLLTGYMALLFIVVSKYMFARDGVVQFVKLVMCVLALTCLFMGYIGASLPLVTVGSCLTLYYSITSLILANPVTMVETGSCTGLTGSEGFSKKEHEGLTRDMVVELVSSPGFEDWMIRNAERIRIPTRR
ncbi:hypothetical protein M8C21_010034 [Ambrosia artemisiifolia]|uniref:Legumain prodomain domain-containing protein n=1 Tax=Ambrosia artemisiifolia TaxID=4212 RepID=A0AAD5CMA7_AMBAR|nr:hypothetical protein M8C21_010034 [Ambrosia artemisiifolia]